MNNIEKTIGGGTTYPECIPSETLDDLLKICPVNETIVNNIVIAWSKINSKLYKNILCPISGGSDSDIMLDICFRCDKDKKIKYIWFDTGLEYEATKEHIKYLENKYCIEVIKYKANKPIPLICKEKGQPFLSKQVSENIQRLQSHDFDFSKGNESFEVLYNKYPKCKSALQWWCNEHESDSYNINKNMWLKMFLIQYPPSFNISNLCCKYSKKDVSKDCEKEFGCDLKVLGLRKSEGGYRSIAYKNCFSCHDDSYDDYRPIFWYKDSDKIDYEKHFGIKHSKCYTEYGLKRTGCAGCPFGRDFEFELETIYKNETKLYKAVTNIFKYSYEYTRMYKDFCKSMNEKYGSFSSYLRNNNMK